MSSQVQKTWIDPSSSNYFFLWRIHFSFSAFKSAIMKLINLTLAHKVALPVWILDLKTFLFFSITCFDFWTFWTFYLLCTNFNLLPSPKSCETVCLSANSFHCQNTNLNYRKIGNFLICPAIKRTFRKSFSIYSSIIFDQKS